MAFLLLEITSRDAYERFYKSIPEDEYYNIIQAVQGKDNDELLLPETKWALGLRKKNSPRFMEDLPKLRGIFNDGYLDIFLRAKERRMISGVQADLNQYKSIAELGRFVGSLDVEAILGQTKGERSNAIHDAKDNVEKLYEDDEWIILIPKSHEASCYWSNGAHWCTAYRDDDKWFEMYSNEGPLFMNMNKNRKELSCQFHLESDQYMDYYDNEIPEPIFENIHDGDTLMDFYQTYLPKEKFLSMIAKPLGENRYSYFRYDYDYGEEGHDEEYAYFIVDGNLNIIAGPYAEITPLKNGVCRVYDFDDFLHLIDLDGNDLFGQPLTDLRGTYKEGTFIGKCCNVSHMDDDGNIKREIGKYKIYDNGKIINTNYINISPYSSKYYFVAFENGKENVLNSEFQPIFKNNYYRVSPLYFNRQVCFKVKFYSASGKEIWNLGDGNGNLLWKKWVYNIISLHEKFVEDVLKVHDDNGWNLWNIKGEPMLSKPIDVISWSHISDYDIVCSAIIGNDCFYLTKYFDIVTSKGKVVYPSNYKKNGVNESRNILSEIKVDDAYTKYYQDIPMNDFMVIISTLQSNNDVLLPETKWALSLYKRKSPRFMEDLYKLHNENGSGYLDIIKRAKDRRIISGQQADLNQYKSISELGMFVSLLDIDKILGKTKGEMSNAVNAAAEDIEIPYEDEKWKVVIPKSYEASCYWGNGTEWCTATRETSEWYEYYSSQGPLYININKRDGQKFQFHFETDSFMDQYDSEMEIPFINEMGENNIEGLVNFYIKLKGKEMKEVFTGYDRNGLKKVYVFDEGGFNLKKEDDGKFLFDRCYEDIGDYDENGFYPVQNEDDEWNLITIDGNYISEIWYNYISNFFDGVAVVGKKGLSNQKSWGMSYNIMNLKGEILLDEWYANIGSFYYGFARIHKNSKVNIVNNKGEIVLPKWYEEIISIDNDGVIVGDYVHNNYMYNKLDFNGNPIYEWVTNRYRVGEKPNTNFWENKTFTKAELKFIEETARKMLE